MALQLSYGKADRRIITQLINVVRHTSNLEKQEANKQNWRQAKATEITAVNSSPPLRVKIVRKTDGGNEQRGGSWEWETEEVEVGKKL